MINVKKKPSPAFNYTLFASEEGNMAFGTKISLAYCSILHHYLCTIPYTYKNMYLLSTIYLFFFLLALTCCAADHQHAHTNEHNHQTNHHGTVMALG